MWITEYEEERKVLKETVNKLKQIMTGCPNVPSDLLPRARPAAAAAVKKAPAKRAPKKIAKKAAPTKKPKVAKKAAPAKKAAAKKTAARM